MKIEKKGTRVDYVLINFQHLIKKGGRTDAASRHRRANRDAMIAQRRNLSEQQRDEARTGNMQSREQQRRNLTDEQRNEIRRGNTQSREQQRRN